MTKKNDSENDQIKNIVSPRTINQEWYDNGQQIIYVEHLNEFSGQYFGRFELWQYPLNTENHNAIMLCWDYLNPNILYNLIGKLATQIKIANNFIDLRRKAG